MPKKSVFLFALFAISFVPWLSSCTSVRATASRDAESFTLAVREAAARVKFVPGVGCFDRSAELMPEDQVHRKADEWAAVRRLDDYAHPGNGYQAPLVRYPKSALNSRTAEAVLVLIFINSDGTVHSSIPVCATASLFEPYAVATVQNNRYRPAELADEPVKGVAFQAVTFSVLD